MGIPFVIISAASFVAGCATIQNNARPQESAHSSATQSRALDSAPRRTALTRALPRGIAEASFELDTGGDQGASPKQAGLAVVVRFSRTELRQRIASCDEPSLGSALGGGADGVLEVALCGAEFWLTTGGGKVIAKRHDEQGHDLEVANIPLPQGIAQAVRPKGTTQ